MDERSGSDSAESRVSGWHGRAGAAPTGGNRRSDPNAPEFVGIEKSCSSAFPVHPFLLSCRFEMILS